jgi:hypothetical protein
LPESYRDSTLLIPANLQKITIATKDDYDREGIVKIDLIGKFSTSTASSASEGNFSKSYDIEPNETIIGLSGSYYEEEDSDYYGTFQRLSLILRKPL